MANKNKDNGNDFGDEEFDVDDFSDDFGDADLDEAALAELEQEGEGFGDEDFEDGAWEDGAEQNSTAKKKKNKDLSIDREKKSFLNFNTIMIIGGVIVGAVIMISTISGKSSTKDGSNTGIFKSVMNISAVMDGTIFGDSKKDPQEGEAADENKDEGFLNNPENVLEGMPNPPQPTPIAPSDTAAMEEDDLTPMPLLPSISDDEEDLAVTPRGPDESPAAPPMANVAPVPQVPAPAVTPPENSAQEVLKKAMAQRAEKAKEEQAALETESDMPLLPPVGEEQVSPEEIEMAEMPEPEVEADVEAVAQPAAPKKEPVPTPPVAQISAPSETTNKVLPATSADAELVSSLETKIDTLLERMAKIESELGNVRDATSEDYGQVSETVDSLRKEIAGLKNRPAPVTETSAVEEAPVKAAPAASAPKKIVKKPAAHKSAAQPSVSKQASAGRWELRAAQPGRAWISRSGERDMQSVEVGQSLPGLGQVTAISYQNGRWTVLATQGRIDQ